MKRLGLLLALAACGGGTEPAPAPAPPPPTVASVVVSLGTSSLVVHQTTMATAAARDSHGVTISGRTISWSSSTPTIASVAADGLVTGLAPGDVVLTATVDGISGWAQLTVTPVPIASVTVTPPTLSLIVSQTSTLTATATDASGNTLGRTFTWASSAPAIASVSTAGVVRALAPGIATITATSEGKAGGATITVAFGAASQLVLTTNAAGLTEQFGQLMVSFDTNLRALSQSQAVIRVGGVDPIEMSAVAQHQMKAVAQEIQRSANVGIGFAYELDKIRPALRRCTERR